MIRKEYFECKDWPSIQIKNLNDVISYEDDNWDSFEEQYIPLKKWCKENCNGWYEIYPIDDGAHAVEIYVGFTFYFKDNADAVAFKLRWL